MTDLTSILSSRDAEYIKCYNKHDVTGVTNMYTEDCRWMQPEKETQIGRDAVKAFLNSVISAGANSLLLDMDENGSLGGDTLVYQRSRYTFLKKDGSVFAKGKLVIIWKKVDGVYHLYTKIFNPSTN